MRFGTSQRFRTALARRYVKGRIAAWRARGQLPAEAASDLSGAIDRELADAERASVHAMGKRMGLTDGDIRQVEGAYEVYKAAFRNKMAVLFPNEDVPF